MIESYPLSWPVGWPRTDASDRVRAKFGRSERQHSATNPGSSWTQKKALNVNDAVWRVLDELKRVNVDVDDVIVSTNIETRADGLPRSDRRAIDGDPGVAVYWPDPDSGAQQCMAIDLYDTVAGNLAAVAATVSALRAIERHGGAQILKRAFEGFKALPAAGGTIVTLSTTQAVHVIARLSGYGADEINMPLVLRDPHHCKRWLRSAKARTHPDAGGRNEDWTLLQEAERVLTAHHGGKLP